MSIRDLLPTEGWLKDFLDHSSKLMMSPPEFRLGVAIATLSATIGRSVSLPDIWGADRTPHVWIALVGPAGHNKSTPLRLSKQLVKMARGDEAILPRQWSPQGFAKALHDMPDGYWEAGELSAFLRSAGRADHMAGAREWLCDVWDGDDDAITKRLSNKGDSLDKAGQLAPTAAVTARPSDFEEASSLADFRSGFFSRFILFTTTDKPDPSAYIGLRRPHGDLDGLTSLARPLADIRRTCIQHPDARFDDDAIALWEAYDRPWHAEADDVAPELSGWAKRRGHQALKLSILHACSRTGRPNVGPEDVAWACGLIADSWASVKAFSLDTIGLDPTARNYIRTTDRARQLVRDNGGSLPVRTLMQRLHLTRKVCNEMLDTWEANGEFVTEKAKRNVTGPAMEVITMKQPVAPVAPVAGQNGRREPVANREPVTATGSESDADGDII